MNNEIFVLINGRRYRPQNITFNRNDGSSSIEYVIEGFYPESVNFKADDLRRMYCATDYTGFYSSPQNPRGNTLRIENVIFNPPATIVFWSDGAKTVVRCKNEMFDPEKGLAMAISKRFFGNTGSYYNHIKKYANQRAADIVRNMIHAAIKIASPIKETQEPMQDIRDSDV